MKPNYYCGYYVVATVIIKLYDTIRRGLIVVHSICYAIIGQLAIEASFQLPFQV